MEQRVIVAGFGGQGVLFVGQLLGYSAMVKGLNATWIPSYGPEMRGGTANCSVKLGDEEIVSPFITRTTHLFAFNEPSLLRFLPSVEPDGVVLVNGSLIGADSLKNVSSQAVVVPALEIAEQLDARNSWNMVMLGVYLQTQTLLSRENLKQGMEKMVGQKHPERIESNLQAISAGMKWMSEQGGFIPNEIVAARH